jgi:hypothetical protein
MFEESTEQIVSLSSPSSCHGNEQTDDEESIMSSTPKRGYQRIEEWDEQQKQTRGEHSWMERVQFDGQRYGNQVRQNDILQRHLHSI